jgi:3-polyprenyl-4-hydroxybenzoate decarboxylase
MVEAEYLDEIVRIHEPADLRFETPSIIFELDRAGRNPVVVFENAGG